MRLAPEALALIPLVFWPGWGDGWNEPKRWLLLAVLAGGAALGAFLPTRRVRVWSWESGLWAAAMGFMTLGWVLRPGGLGATEARELALAGALWAVLFWVEAPGRLVFERAFGMLEWAGVCVSVLVLVQFLGWDPVGAGGPEYSLKWRAYGTMGNPNRVGAFLGLVLLSLPRVRWAAPAGRWAGVRRAGILAGLLLTFSRGAWLMVAAVTLIWRPKPRELARAGGALALLFGLAALGALPESWSKPLLNGASITGRFHHLVEAARLWAGTDLWLGLGIGRYTLRLDVSAEYVHSDVLGLFVEGGLVVAAPALLAWGLRLKAVWSAFQDTQARHRLSSVAHRAAAVLVGVSFLSLYEFPLRDPGVLAVVCLALWASRACSEEVLADDRALPPADAC